MIQLNKAEQTEILKQYYIGKRVELHPATDEWMQGDRYGTIVRVAKASVSIKMDKSGRTLKATENDYTEID